MKVLRLRVALGGVHEREALELQVVVGAGDTVLEGVREGLSEMVRLGPGLVVRVGEEVGPILGLGDAVSVLEQVPVSDSERTALWERAPVGVAVREGVALIRGETVRVQEREGERRPVVEMVCEALREVERVREASERVSEAQQVWLQVGVGEGPGDRGTVWLADGVGEHVREAVESDAESDPGRERVTEREVDALPDGGGVRDWVQVAEGLGGDCVALAVRESEIDGERVGEGVVAAEWLPVAVAVRLRVDGERETLRVGVGLRDLVSEPVAERLCFFRDVPVPDLLPVRVAVVRPLRDPDGAEGVPVAEDVPVTVQVAGGVAVTVHVGEGGEGVDDRV